MPYVHLVWEYGDEQWVELSGGGRYDNADRLREVAERLVDRPQAVPLQVHLAPAGWSVQGYKDDRILTLVNDSYEQQTLSVYIPLPEDVVPPENLLGQLMGPIGPVVPVTVQGRPAHLVPGPVRLHASGGVVPAGTVRGRDDLHCPGS